MRTIIRNLKTGSYLSEEGWWTKDRKLARVFDRVEAALFYRSQQPLKGDLLIIWQPRDELP